MKSLFSIVRRYMFLAFFLIIILISLNIGLFFCYTLRYEKLFTRQNGVQYYSEALRKKDDAYFLPKKVMKQLQDSDVIFAMELNEQGNIIWSYRLPKALNRSYSLSDMVSMTRWYLDDYPVRMWKNDYGIFITGKQKNSVWKLTVERPVSIIKDTPKNFFYVISLNLCGILLVFLFIGWKLFVALRPIAKGIDQLTVPEKMTLPEKGITADLSHKLNETSRILETQKNRLDSRDTARTNWINGVSHDIRTPLSMIMGYTDILLAEETFSPDQMEKLTVIKAQSIRIKELIEDLNLTSKLEYDMQPLRSKAYRIGSLLREIVTEYYNHDLPEMYSITLYVSKDAEQITLYGDTALLKRAFRNLIGNSIRHNPSGCDIVLSAKVQKTCCCLSFSDTGKGIPADIIRHFQKKEIQAGIEKTKNQPHILGLILVKQIVESHGGRMNFLLSKGKSNTVEILLPLPDSNQ